MTAAELTIRHAQMHQPWTVPYSRGVEHAAESAPSVVAGGGPLVPHILGSHCVLHAMKSIGKIAAVYEARDHVPDADATPDWAAGEHVRKAEIRKMAADLLTAALRFANLEGFDLAEALVERVREKNGVGYPALVVEELQPGEAPKAFQPHVAERRYVLTEIHEKDAYVEDQNLIGETFVRGTEWQSPHEGYLAGMFKRLPDGESFTFLAAKFEALS